MASKLYPAKIGALFIVSVYLILSVLIVEILTAQLLHRYWLNLLSSLRLAPLPEYLFFALSFDTLVLTLFSFLPGFIMLTLNKCYYSKKVFKRYFILFAIPSVLIWHIIMLLLISPQRVISEIQSEGQFLWRYTLGASTSAEVIGFMIMYYGILNAPRRTGIGKKHGESH